MAAQFRFDVVLRRDHLITKLPQKNLKTAVIAAVFSCPSGSRAADIVEQDVMNSVTPLPIFFVYVS
jgi:hypothetical protein